jgi:integrase/recombinase XerC
MPPAPRSKGGHDMCPRPIGKTIAEKYDLTLLYARDKCLPANAPRPRPTRFWPKENVELLERFHAWLIDGGACKYSTDLIYLPIAGHVLGLNLKSHEQIDLDTDLHCALEYVRAKGVGVHWQEACQHGLDKFHRFLRLERGLGEVSKKKPFVVGHHTQGLPAWLVSELERFQRVQQRNWRMSRIDENIRRFWCTHLRIWRFLCQERKVVQFADLKRAHIQDYLDHRLDEGHPPTGVNTELHYLHGFLQFLQDEGYLVPQSLLSIPGLKEPDPLPKYLTDEQVRLLRDDFEQRVMQAKLSNHKRDALLDRAIFQLLWQCGLRAGEVEELRLEDLDLGSRRLTVRNGKGRKDRTVYITDSVVNVLNDYLAVRGAGSGDHVFLYRNAPLKKDLIHARIKYAGERVGVKVHPHRLRHTCATQLLNAGCRITSIQKYLGHKELSTTMIYARVLDQTMADDYFKAMQQIEQQLTLPAEIMKQPVSTSEMLDLVDQLLKSRLNPEQHEIVLAIYSGLNRSKKNTFLLYSSSQQIKNQIFSDAPP